MTFSWTEEQHDEETWHFTGHTHTISTTKRLSLISKKTVRKTTTTRNKHRPALLRTHLPVYQHKQQSNQPTTMMVQHLTSLSILVGVLQASCVHGVIPFRSNNQQLVILAGPHKTSETAIEEFFYSFARGDTPEFEKEASLQGWSWPQVLGLGSPHKAYNQLVTSTEDVKAKILGVLEGHKDRASKGFIIGGPEFDRVGDTAWSNWDAIDMVTRVADTLEINQEDVTIVLLYKLPRIEQWLSIISEEAAEWEQNSQKEYDDHYEAFICDPDTESERRESIATAMNPFGVADSYIDAGYHVVMVDLDGVRKQGLDPAHVVGCQVLGAPCTNGYLTGLENESFEANTDKHDIIDHPFADLSVEDITKMEQLFQFRDCYYRNIGTDPKFAFALESTLFETCPSDDTNFFSVEMENSDLLLNALQSLKGCNSRPVSVEGMTAQQPMEVEIENPERYIGPAAGSSTSESGFSTSTASSSSNSGDGDVSSPTSPAVDEPRQSWFLPALFGGLAIVGAGMIIHIGRRERHRYRLDGEEMDGIIAAVHEDPNRPLSEVM